MLASQEFEAWPKHPIATKFPDGLHLLGQIPTELNLAANCKQSPWGTWLQPCSPISSRQSPSALCVGKSNPLRLEILYIM